MENKILVTIIAAVIATAIFVPRVSAETIIVGGSTGWDVSTNFTMWSASVPIYVNDTLSFNYSRDHDVIEVSQAGFATCDKRGAYAIYTDGHTLIELAEPGSRYFICARSNHCALGLKLQVRVLDTPNTMSTNNSNNHLGPDGPDGHDEHPVSSSCDSTEFSQAWVSLALCFCSLLFVLLETFDHHLLVQAASLPRDHPGTDSAY